MAAKLIIELDGEIHDSSEQAEYDTGRTFTLTELGCRELRFTNQQVLTRLDEVLTTIQENLQPSHCSLTSRQAPPLRGRGGWGVR